MSVTFPVHIYRTQLAQIMQSVFETMLRISIEPADSVWSPQPDSVTSAIYFAGEWKGGVLLECTSQQALHFTSQLMSIPAPCSMNDDVRDTMGELANMVAGNLKSVLPRGVGMSMPSVVEGSDYSLRICGGNIVDRVPFVTVLGLLWVMVVEMKD